jgi:hypothetical protein
MLCMFALGCILPCWLLTTWYCAELFLCNSLYFHARFTGACPLMHLLMRCILPRRIINQWLECMSAQITQHVRCSILYCWKTAREITSIFACYSFSGWYIGLEKRHHKGRKRRLHCCPPHAFCLNLPHHCHNILHI